MHPWGHDGRSNDDNLAHLCRKHQRLKGSGYSHTELDDRGRMLRVSMFGRRYVTEPADEPSPVVLLRAEQDPAPFDLPKSA